MKENVIKWLGGKNQLGEEIIKLMPPHKTYVEVFMGGGNIFLQKPLADINIVNDLNGNLINMYKVINDEKKKELLKQLFDECVYSRELFEYFRSMYKDSMEYIKLEQVMRAFIYIYLNRCSFNGQFQTYARRDDSSVLYSLDKVINAMFNKFQAGKTVFEKLPFEELLSEMNYEKQPATISLLKYDRQDVFIYLDPPYYVTTEAVGQLYYEKVMKVSEHTLLRDILFKHKRAKWLMSYDDHPRVRQLYGLPPEGNVMLSKEEGVHARLTTNTFQSSGSLVEGESIFKRELLIANYNIEKVGTFWDE